MTRSRFTAQETSSNTVTVTGPVSRLKSGEVRRTSHAAVVAAAQSVSDGWRPDGVRPEVTYDVTPGVHTVRWV